MQQNGQQAPMIVGSSNWTAVDPSWLRHRSLGKLPRGGQHMPWSIEMMGRLGQEASLKGHRGCVNCLEWNEKGNLLASGSDDGNVIIWDAFERKKQHVVQTAHDGPIFSVKFMPNTSDIDVASCAGNGISVIDSLQHRTLLNCNQCHSGRVKRLAVHPHEPNLIWSAAEDGQILEYDTRLNHVCNSSRPSNLLVDLKTISTRIRAKCIAVNPVKSEMLAVGSDDTYTRLLDRRHIKLTDLNSNKNNNASCLTNFAPGHVLFERCNNIQSHGVTYLTFNSRGTEILASYHGEQVYLFDIRKPRDRFQSFEQTIKPLLLGGSHCRQPKHVESSSTKRIRLCEPDASENLPARAKFLAEIDECNQYISEAAASPMAYRRRSKLLFKRDWRGDRYQALRDLIDALAINPMSARTIHLIAEFFTCADDLDTVNSLADFIRLHHYDYMSEFEMQTILNLLEDFKRNADNRTPPLVEHRYGNQSMMERHMRLTDRPHINFSKRNLKDTVFDYTQRYCGHCNMNTDIKEANFFGPNDEYIVSGSDDGAFYLWDKNTTNIIKAVDADNYNVNCVQPHPNIPMLATSGVESSVRLWSPIGPICSDVVPIADRFYQNQEFIKIDPLDIMIRRIMQQPLHLRLARMNAEELTQNNTN